MENTKELFAKAFMEAERIDHNGLPGEDKIEWYFSKKFEKSIDKLIRQNNRIQLSTRRTVTKSLLAAIVAVLILFTGLMSCAAIREPIVEFVKKVFPKYNEITLIESSIPPVDNFEIEYTLTNLPEGYELKEYQKYHFKLFSVWENENNEEIVFSQNLLDSSFTIDNEHGYREFEINGFKAYLTEDTSGAFLIWSDGYYWFTLNVPSSSKDEIIIMAENISEKN